MLRRRRRGKGSAKNGEGAGSDEPSDVHVSLLYRQGRSVHVRIDSRKHELDNPLTGNTAAGFFLRAKQVKRSIQRQKGDAIPS